MSAFGAKNVRARKTHICTLCGEPVSIGTLHESWTYTDGDLISTVRAHFRCVNKATLFDWWMDDDWPEESYPLRLSLEDTDEWESFKAGGTA